MRLSIAFFIVLATGIVEAQQPFYTDDAGTTAKHTFHFEFFNEFDRLQTEQAPNRHQNTASFKVNYGLTDSIELDLDNPYLSILRDRFADPPLYHGVGDTNLGVKWAFHKETPRSPAFSATMYFEFPTGDSSRSLGSGLTDYWLNGIAQKTFAKNTKVTANGGILFAGNTSVGLIGIQTRGRVYTGGLSAVRKYTEKLSFGLEATGAVSKNLDLARGQLQFLGGGVYQLRQAVAFTFALLGGKYIASPVVGGQVGLAIDFPPIRSSGSRLLR